MFACCYNTSALVRRNATLFFNHKVVRSHEYLAIEQFLVLAWCGVRCDTCPIPGATNYERIRYLPAQIFPARVSAQEPLGTRRQANQGLPGWHSTRLTYLRLFRGNDIYLRYLEPDLRGSTLALSDSALWPPARKSTLVRSLSRACQSASHGTINTFRSSVLL